MSCQTTSGLPLLGCCRTVLVNEYRTKHLQYVCYGYPVGQWLWPIPAQTQSWSYSRDVNQLMRFFATFRFKVTNFVPWNFPRDPLGWEIVWSAASDGSGQIAEIPIIPFPDHEDINLEHFSGLKEGIQPDPANIYYLHPAHQTNPLNNRWTFRNFDNSTGVFEFWLSDEMDVAGWVQSKLNAAENYAPWPWESGYGFGWQSVTTAYKDGFRLVLTLDNRQIHRQVPLQVCHYRLRQTDSFARVPAVRTFQENISTGLLAWPTQFSQVPLPIDTFASELEDFPAQYEELTESASQGVCPP